MNTKKKVLYDYLNNYFTLTYFNKGVFQCLKKPLSTQQIAHNGQTRKGTNLPFIIHPMEVAAIVAAMTLDQDMLCAAVLHDVVEDCDGISIEDIRREFGDIVLLMSIRKVKIRVRHGLREKAIRLIS